MATDPAVEVAEAALAYICEYDNMVPDYSHRRHLRDHLRTVAEEWDRERAAALRAGT